MLIVGGIEVTARIIKICRYSLKEMPRNAPSNSCITCRRRKIKCDGRQPVCQNCVRSQRACHGANNDLKFVIYTAMPDPKVLDQQTNYLIDGKPNNLESFDVLIQSNPRMSLNNPEIAGIFRHYIDSLAPWYDLCESECPFGRQVPIHALDNYILFKALIAFAAYHKSRVSGRLQGLGQTFHSSCVRDLLEVIEAGNIRAELREDYLAATCLLRSYEIMTADSRKQQRHLLGAYIFSASESMDMNHSNLSQAGIWNYLREEITVALECRRPARIDFNFVLSLDEIVQNCESMQANMITQILARVINHCFEQKAELFRGSIVTWQTLRTELTDWTKQLPPTFEPYSTASKLDNPFPSLWLIQGWHIAAMQYLSIAEILLTISSPESPVDHALVLMHALRICGIAYTNENVAARVNAFGPLAFCGRYLVSEKHRTGLKNMLIDFGKPTAWPIHCIIEDLETCWRSQDKDSSSA